jgi:peptidoglycan glycosyltransferase
MLLLSSAIVALGAALVCLGMGHSIWRVPRAVTVVGGFIAAALMLDLADPRRDRMLLPVVSLLAGCGLILLWQLDVGAASRQVVWMLTGAGLMVAVYYLIADVRDLSRHKYTCGVGSLALMVLTMIYGQEHGGARLWLGIPGLISFQPTEVVKVLICIFLAGYIADRAELLRLDTRAVAAMHLPRLKHLAPVVVLVAFCLAIFVAQRDLGAAVLFFGLFVAMTYLATGRKSLAVVALGLFAVGAVGVYYTFPHVAARIDMWINPWQDPTDRGYQILQALFSLAEGGILGTGFGSGVAASIPAATTDLIFAVGAEQLGLVGSVALLLLFALVAYRSYSIAWQATDRFCALLAAGLATVFSLQTLVIVGGVTKLVPLTGITLPFMSYGGTSVVVNFVALALLLAVSRDCAPHGSAAED